MRRRLGQWSVATVTVVTVLMAAACTTPIPGVPVIPAAYPPCVTSPICVIDTNAVGSGPAAISDNGETLAIGALVPGGVAVQVLGIHQRWFSTALTAAGAYSVGVTHDGRVLGIEATGVHTSLPEKNGFFLYNQSTGVLTRPNQPAETAQLSAISSDGTAAALAFRIDPTNVYSRVTTLTLLDLIHGTYSSMDVPDGVADLHLSSDGGTVVWRDGDISAGESSVPADVHVLDRATTTDTVVGQGDNPSVSADGSRVGFVRVYDDGDAPRQSQLVYWDRSTATVVPFSASSAADFYPDAEISADGSRMIVWHTKGFPIFLGSIEDWTISSGSSAVIAGPVPAAVGFQMSTNGSHVIFDYMGSTPPGYQPTAYYLWNR